MTRGGLSDLPAARHPAAALKAPERRLLTGDRTANLTATWISAARRHVIAQGDLSHRPEETTMFHPIRYRFRSARTWGLAAGVVPAVLIAAACSSSAGSSA